MGLADAVRTVSRFCKNSRCECCPFAVLHTSYFDDEYKYQVCRLLTESPSDWEEMVDSMVTIQCDKCGAVLTSKTIYEFVLEDSPVGKSNAGIPNAIQLCPECMKWFIGEMKRGRR